MPWDKHKQMEAGHLWFGRSQDGEQSKSDAVSSFIDIKQKLHHPPKPERWIRNGGINNGCGRAYFVACALSHCNQLEAVPVASSSSLKRPLVSII